VGSNSEIQGYNLYPMLHFHRKFSSGITAVLDNNPLLMLVSISLTSFMQGGSSSVILVL